LYSLKSLSEGNDVGTSILEVFSLGILADKFEKIASITQKEIETKLKEVTGLTHDKNNSNFIAVVPIPVSESEKT
jgi:hypothetical protein